MFPEMFHISIRGPINDFVQSLVVNYGFVFKAISHTLLQAILFVEWILRGLPWWAVFIVFLVLAWFAAKKISLVVTVAVMLFAVGALGLWDLTMQTLALMLIASLISVAIGVPMGIWLAKSELMRRVTLPVLDVMQTMPSFVYLIPAIMLFGLGKVPAVLATIIYAVPPLIRLTDLGIRQVDGEVVEAATAFGGSPGQILFGVELPLATPTIMAGLNQTIMMALSMVVVASMIGARGLGEQVLNGIQTLDVGKGLEAGLGKVPAVLATIIYAVPPLIRLTDLGIRQVDGEVVEAATAFGGSPGQILFGVELPLATPTIMAGLNQTIMMALSMVVVASMIGARGLGEQVLNGIQTLDVGKGLEAGLGIVILAIVLDRITQGFGQSSRKERGND